MLITLAITKFNIGELIMNNLIALLIDRFFWSRQRAQTFGEYLEFLNMNRNLASLCSEHKTFHTYNIADIHKLKSIVHFIDIVLFKIYLNFSEMILDMGK